MLTVAGLSQAIGVEHFSGWIPDTTTTAYVMNWAGPTPRGGGGYSDIFIHFVRIGSGHFLGFKNLIFNIFGGFSEKYRFFFLE